MPDALSQRTSVELLSLVKKGEQSALEELCRRYLPHLEDWASGRLPMHHRDLNDTGDIVQEVMIRVMGNLDGFEPRNEAALLYYLRQAVRNRITDEIRRAERRPVDRMKDAEIAASPDPVTPLDHVLGSDLGKRYERALLQLKESDQKILRARFKFDGDYDKIAAATGRPSAHAARMAASRALVRLAAELDQDDV